MKTIIFALSVLIIAVAFSSCQKINGKGETVRISRPVSDITGIELSMDATVYYTQGDSYSLEIEAQENLLEYIETISSGNNLVIREEKGIILGNHDPIRIYITVPGINSLSISGSGTINVKNGWSGNDLTTNICGSGNINITTLHCNHITSEVSGSGNTEMHSGKCNHEDLRITGSGGIDLRMVECDSTNADISGSGDIYINVAKLLEAAISGSGNINYYGNPVINTHISGSGNIARL
jgi:hypothetical protein